MKKAKKKDGAYGTTDGTIGCWRHMLPIRCHYRGHQVVDAELVRSYEDHVEGECDACAGALDDAPDNDTYVEVDGVTTQRYVWLCEECECRIAQWETTPEPWMLAGGERGDDLVEEPDGHAAAATSAAVDAVVRGGDDGVTLLEDGTEDD